MHTESAPQPREDSHDNSFLDARRYPVWFRCLVAGVFLSIAFAIVADMAIFLLVGVVVLVPLERVFQRHRMPVLRPELMTDFMHIWVTQEYHHWHNARDKEAHDRNYAGALPLWDLVFGTYYMPQGKRPEDYGIEDHIPKNYLGQLVHPFRRLPE